MKKKPNNLSSLCRRLIVSLEEQEVLILPKNVSSPPVFSRVRATRYLVLCVMFCGSLFVLFLLAILLSILLRFTDFYYPFGIFKLFLSSLYRSFIVHVP